MFRENPRSLRRAISGWRPEPSHPRHSPDTAPKGAGTHPGDGCLSVGTASMPFSYIYHAWRRKSARVTKQTEANPIDEPMRTQGVHTSPRASKGRGAFRTLEIERRNSDTNGEI